MTLQTLFFTCCSAYKQARLRITDFNAFLCIFFDSYSPVCCFSGVGSNLQDHLELYVQQQCTQPITLYKAQKPFHMVKIGLEWLTLFTGNQRHLHVQMGTHTFSKIFYKIILYSTQYRMYKNTVCQYTVSFSHLP